MVLRASPLLHLLHMVVLLPIVLWVSVIIWVGDAVPLQQVLEIVILLLEICELPATRRNSGDAVGCSAFCMCL